MYTISIGELQKNISFLTQFTEVFTIVDKRKNRSVAVVYPITTYSVVALMAGKYKNRVTPTDDLSVAKNRAMMEAMGEKYGLSY